jgi:hypothetical protein
MRQASGVWRRLLTGIVPAICLSAGLFAPAMADDYRIESTKRSVETLVERWAAAEIELGAQLAPIREEFATKEQPSRPAMRKRRGSPNCDVSGTRLPRKWKPKATTSGSS